MKRVLGLHRGVVASKVAGREGVDRSADRVHLELKLLRIPVAGCLKDKVSQRWAKPASPGRSSADPHSAITPIETDRTRGMLSVTIRSPFSRVDLANVEESVEPTRIRKT